MSFRVTPGVGPTSCRLVCEHRTQALDASARWKFALYCWLLVKLGSAIMVKLMFNAVKRRAERDILSGGPTA
jgi:hypothetical protein